MIRTTGTLPIRHNSDYDRFVANDDDDIDAPLRGLAARNDACFKVAVTIFHSQSGVRKQLCHFLCRNGFRHGMVKREDSKVVQVVIVFPFGIQVDMNILSEYFGATWGVTQEYFHIDRNCRDSSMVGLLSKPFVLLKSNVDDPQNASDEDFDMYNSDDGGYEIRSVGSIDF